MDSTTTTASTGATLLGLIIILVLFTIPSVIVFFKLYKKANQPGWTAIVPVYSSIIMAKIAKKPIWLGTLVGVAGAIVWGMRATVGNDSPIQKIAMLTYIIFGLYLIAAFIKKYDRGIGAWVLYIFLPMIGVFIVDKAQYKDSAPTGPVNPSPGPTGSVPVQPQVQPSTIAPVTPEQPSAQQPPIQ